MIEGSLLNRKQCKAFALRWAQEKRPGWVPTRISKQYLDDLEAKMRLWMQESIKRHPSCGKTIKYLF